MDSEARRWRDIFLEVVSDYPDETPILLSGGLDSGTILAACLALDRKPDCYSFRIGDHRSTDLIVAEKMCQKYDLDFRVIIIPRDEDLLVDDIKHIISRFNTTRKTSVQCSQPMLYMTKMVAADGHDLAYCGTGGVVEDNRSCSVLLAKDGEEAARKYRTESLVKRGAENTATRIMHLSAEHNGVALAEPFTDEPFRSYSLALDMAEINKPVLKGIAARAFPEFWIKNRWYRRNSSLQVNTGIREWHDTLLQTRFNRRHSKRIIGVYNDLAEDMA